MAAPVTQRSVPELLQDIASNLQDMIRGEFRLAKAEFKEDASRAGGPAKALAIGSVISIYGVGFLLLAALYGLAKVVEPWAAALIVGGSLTIIGTIAIRSAAGRLKHIDPTPEKTIRSLEENAKWAKDRMK